MSDHEAELQAALDRLQLAVARPLPDTRAQLVAERDQILAGIAHVGRLLVRGEVDAER